MGFQTTVNRYPDIGVQGQIGTLNPATYAPYSALADEDGVTVGNGVFYDADTGLASKAKGDGVYAGIVVRLMDHAYYTVTDEASMELSEGQTVTILVSGDIFIKASEAANFGDYVYCATATGILSFDSTTTAPTGTVATGFRVARAGASGDIILISSLGVK